MFEAAANVIASVGAQIIDAIDRHTEAIVNHMGAVDELRVEVSNLKVTVHDQFADGIDLNYEDPPALTTDGRLERAIDMAAKDIAAALKAAL